MGGPNAQGKCVELHLCLGHSRAEAKVQKAEANDKGNRANPSPHGIAGHETAAEDVQPLEHPNNTG